MQKDSGIWFKSPKNMSREEVIANHDKAIREMCSKSCPPSHIISYGEIRPGTFHWKCSVCGPVATVTLFRPK